MWIYVYILLALLIVVFVFYIISKRRIKPNPSSIVQRSKLESMLQKELIPKEQLENEDEKGDFRYRDDYKTHRSIEENNEVLDEEYKLILKDGIAKYKAKDYDGAELEFSKIIESGTVNAATYYYIGLIKIKKLDYAEAVNDFDFAFTYGFQEPDLFLQRGISNYHLKLYEKACADLGAYLAMKPNDTKGYFNKGLSEAALGHLTAAIADFTKIIALNPKLELAYYERGKCHLKLEDKEAACKDFREAYIKGCLAAHHYLKTECNQSTDLNSDVPQ
jgi:Tetratricopeptide repeat